MDIKGALGFGFLLIIGGAAAIILPPASLGQVSKIQNSTVYPLQTEHSVKAWKNAILDQGNGCYCLNDTCACCEHFDIPRLKINDTGCLELIYLRKEYGFSFLFVIDSVVIINRTVSAHNPPPICYGVPHVSAADLCVRFHDLDMNNKTFSGCMAVEAEVAHMKVYEKEVGCFKVPTWYRSSKVPLGVTNTESRKPLRVRRL